MQRVVQGPAATAMPGSLRGTQNLKPFPEATKPICVLRNSPGINANRKSAIKKTFFKRKRKETPQVIPMCTKI